MVRYVTTQKGLQLRLPSLGATTASSLFGGAVSSHLQDEELVIDVDELYLYEAILIEV